MRFDGLSTNIIDPMRLQWKISSHLQLPRGMSIIVRSVHLGLFFERCITRIHRRIESPGAYLCGAYMNASIGKNAFIRVTAQIVVISRIMLSCVEISAKLAQDCSAIKKAFCFSGKSLHRAFFATKKKGGFYFFLVYRVELIAKRVYKMLFHLWQMNVSLFELYDTIRLDQHTSSAIVDDLFLELGRVARQVCSSERQLAQAVSDHAEWVNSVLKILEISWTAEMIKDKLEYFVEQSEKVGRICNIPIRIGHNLMQLGVDHSKKLVQDQQGEKGCENSVFATCPTDHF